MKLEFFDVDAMPGYQTLPINKNLEELTRPFESQALSGHFSFGHGHFLLNGGWDS